MRPNEVSFDRLHMWIRVPNLPYNLRNEAGGKLIAQQIDKKASMVQFDHVGGYLRARVSIDVNKPLRRWILINSAKRKKEEAYDIQYEHVPHFCFSCGRLGHNDAFCPTPGPRDKNGELPFGVKLRAPEERKKPSSGEYEQSSGASIRRESKNSSNAADPPEVTSPAKNWSQGKRKEAPQKVYRPIVQTLLLTNGANNDLGAKGAASGVVDREEEDAEGVRERETKKKKPTPENSAASVGQGCPFQ